MKATAQLELDIQFLQTISARLEVELSIALSKVRSGRRTLYTMRHTLEQPLTMMTLEQIACRPGTMRANCSMLRTESKHSSISSERTATGSLCSVAARKLM